MSNKTDTKILTAPHPETEKKTEKDNLLSGREIVGFLADFNDKETGTVASILDKINHMHMPEYGDLPNEKDCYKMLCELDQSVFRLYKKLQRYHQKYDKNKVTEKRKYQLIATGYSDFYSHTLDPDTTICSVKNCNRRTGHDTGKCGHHIIYKY